MMLTNTPGTQDQEVERQNGNAKNGKHRYLSSRTISSLPTLGQAPERKLYNWTSPGELYRNQIDYIMINARLHIRMSRLRPNLCSDCNPVVRKIKLKKLKTKQQDNSIELRHLENDHYKDGYSIIITKVQCLVLDYKPGTKGRKCIKDKNVEFVFEEEGIDKRWVEHATEFYND
eukprot:gene599-1258_t